MLDNRGRNIIQHYVGLVYAQVGYEIDLEDVRQELHIEAWKARQDFQPEKGTKSWHLFLGNRLYWKALKLLRKVRQNMAVEIAFRERYTGDFAAPSYTLCGLSYELERRLMSSEARKVFEVLQTVPMKQLAPDYTGPCPTESQVAAYLGIAELSVTRGIREIKRHLKALLHEQR